MDKFKVGDRVQCVEPYKDREYKLDTGEVGTIIVDRGNGSRLQYGVRWDNIIRGHSLSGRCEPDHGLWVSANHIQLWQDVVFEDEFDEVCESDFIHCISG